MIFWTLHKFRALTYIDRKYMHFRLDECVHYSSGFFIMLRIVLYPYEILEHKLHSTILLLLSDTAEKVPLEAKDNDHPLAITLNLATTH